MAALVDKLKVVLNAKVIFARSTTVIEESANHDFFRCSSDIERYNEIAITVMNELGVEVNGLYTLLKPFDKSIYLDCVHFGSVGSKILADKVIEACFKGEE